MEPGSLDVQSFGGCVDEGPLDGLCVRWFKLPSGNEFADDFETSGQHSEMLTAGEQVRYRVQIKVKPAPALDTYDLEVDAQGDLDSDAGMLRVKVG